jgi:agmatinase
MNEMLIPRSYDNTWALTQIEEGHYSILSRNPATDANKRGPAIKGKTLPRVITLGGDHTITLPLLRSINRAYGPVSVIHFDSHLDTCKIPPGYCSRILIIQRETQGIWWITV